MNQIGTYRTLDGGLAAYDSRGMTWRIPEPDSGTALDVPRAEHATAEAPVDPFAGLEEPE